jgi:dTMP kinase
MSHQRGFFLTLEGGDGAGKSTLLAGLAERLRLKGREVLSTREPGGCPLAESVRHTLLAHREGLPIQPRAELLLFLAARAQHLVEQVRPALDAGVVVCCDRYNDSSVAYQGYGRGLPIPEVETLCGLATEGLQPDLTFYLDLPPEQGLHRARRNGEPDRMEQEALSFHQRVRMGYLDLAQRFPHRIMVLEAAEKPEQILEKAWKELERRLIER